MCHAIADNSKSTFDHIRDNGFETSLEQLICYAELQAKLHQSLGDRDQWIFWVRSWANLQKASDAIAFPMDETDCLDMWKKHCEGYATVDLDFEFEK